MLSKTLKAFSFALLAMAAPAAAQEITLKIADTLPANHNVYKYGLSKFMDDVRAASNGAIEFEYYPAQQLGKIKDMLTLVQTGVVDIAMVSPGQVSEKLPITTVTELPGLYSNSCEGTEAFLSATGSDGILHQRELEKNQIRRVIAYMYQPYDALVASRSIEKAADWQGLKVRTAGGPTELGVAAMGGVPIRTAPSDLYESLSRGTVDGALLVSTSARAYNLDTIIKSVTTGFSVGSSSMTYMISQASWNRLSAEHQEILRKAGEDASRNLCAETDRLQGEEIAYFEAAGIKINRVSAEEQEAWAGMMEPVFVEWASQARLNSEEAAEMRSAVSPK